MDRLGFACYVSLSVGLYVVIDEHVSVVTVVPQKSPQLKTFNSFGVASTAVLRQFRNASREKTEPIIVPHWSNGQSGTLKKFVFASKATLR